MSLAVNMETEPTYCNLIAQLRQLQTDYDRMRSLALEIRARGYGALLASTMFASRAHELRNRAVRLFDQAAHVLRPVEEARNVRRRLLRTSQQLAALFDESSGASTHREPDFEAQVREPTLEQLLYELDTKSLFHDGMSLHDRVLSVASATGAALHAWRPPPQ